MRKKNNKKGFTLVELLAALVILGLLTLIAAPNIIGILQGTKVNTYVNDAEKLVTMAEYKFRGDSSIKKPDKKASATAIPSCTIMNLDYLGSGEFQNPPYGDKYSGDGSFVLIVRTDTDSSPITYKYYVQIMDQKGTGSNTTYGGVKAMSIDKLKESNATDYVSTAYTSVTKLTASTAVNTQFSYIDEAGSTQKCKLQYKYT